MKQLHIFKAKDIAPSARTESLTIIVDEPLPDQDTLGGLEVLYECEANQLEEALHNTLPGGVYDRLLANMLRKAGGMSVIPSGRPEEEES